MMKRAGRWIAMTALLAAVWSSTGGTPDFRRTAVLAVREGIVTQEVRGQVEYQEGRADWQPLATGKLLRAGAVIRTGPESSALLKFRNRTSLVRISPATSLRLIAERDESVAGIPGFTPEAYRSTEVRASAD